MLVDNILESGVVVTGPPGALLFDVKPEIALKESLELQFCLTCRLGHLLHSFPVIPVRFVKHSMQFMAQHLVCKDSNKQVRTLFKCEKHMK